MAMPAQTTSIFKGVQGPGQPELINQKRIMETFKAKSNNNDNGVYKLTENITKTVQRRPARASNGKMTMQCIIIAKRNGSLVADVRDITITQLPRNKIKLFTGQDQAEIVKFMYPSATETRGTSKVLWAKREYVQRELSAYVAYSSRLKSLICISENVMTPRQGTLSREGTMFMAVFMTTVRNGTHVAYKIKLKSRGDEKVVKTPVKISPKTAKFIFCTSLSSFFRNRN
jgi:hypothetical protein